MYLVYIVHHSCHLTFVPLFSVYFIYKYTWYYVTYRVYTVQCTLYTVHWTSHNYKVVAYILERTHSTIYDSSWITFTKCRFWLVDIKRYVFINALYTSFYVVLLILHNPLSRWCNRLLQFQSYAISNYIYIQWKNKCIIL